MAAKHKSKFEIFTDKQIIRDWIKQQTESRFENKSLVSFLEKVCYIDTDELAEGQLVLVRRKGQPFSTLVAFDEDFDERIYEFLYLYGQNDMLCVHEHEGGIFIYWRWTADLVEVLPLVQQDFEVAGDSWCSEHAHYSEIHECMINTSCFPFDFE